MKDFIRPRDNADRVVYGRPGDNADPAVKSLQKAIAGTTSIMLYGAKYVRSQNYRIFFLNSKTYKTLTVDTYYKILRGFFLGF